MPAPACECAGSSCRPFTAPTFPVLEPNPPVERPRRSTVFRRPTRVKVDEHIHSSGERPAGCVQSGLHRRPVVLDDHLRTQSPMAGRSRRCSTSQRPQTCSWSPLQAPPALGLP